MDLQGKYLAIWIRTSVASDIFNLPQTEERWWIAVGQVVESHTGIWFTIEWWEQVKGGRYSSEGHTYLVLWQWIGAARLFSELPKSSIGFRLPQPEGPASGEEQR